MEISTETTNVSRFGLFIASPVPLEMGTSLSLSLRVPARLSGNALSMQHRCRARVVHKQKLTDGTLGYGLEIEQAFPQLQRLVAEDMNSLIGCS